MKPQSLKSTKKIIENRIALCLCVFVVFYNNIMFWQNLTKVMKSKTIMKPLSLKDTNKNVLKIENFVPLCLRGF